MSAEVWLEKRICTVDRLGEGFLNEVRSGMALRVYEDGMVEVFQKFQDAQKTRRFFNKSLGRPNRLFYKRLKAPAFEM